MLRRLSTILSLLSLLLCAATCVLWVRSYSVADIYCWASRSGTESEAGSYAGGMFVTETQRVPAANDMTGLLFSGGSTGDSLSYEQRPATKGATWTDRYSASALIWQGGGFGLVSDGSNRMTVQKIEERGDITAISGVAGPVLCNRVALVVPYWALVMATGILPAWLGLRIGRWGIRRRSSRSGLCPSCGYDLRASPERCPECGR